MGIMANCRCCYGIVCLCQVFGRADEMFQLSAAPDDGVRKCSVQYQQLIA